MHIGKKPWHRELQVIREQNKNRRHTGESSKSQKTTHLDKLIKTSGSLWEKEISERFEPEKQSDRICLLKKTILCLCSSTVTLIEWLE